jgi:hypothetical protein
VTSVATLPCVVDRLDPLRDVHPTMADFLRPFVGIGASDKVREEFAAGLDSVDDERNPERELQDDQARDMARRSA